MTLLFNWQKHKNIRRTLRKNSTKGEKILWSKLRNRNLGYKFRRQYSIENFVVDFYCPELKLVIEVDGVTHISDEEVRHDKIRQEYLESLDLTVKRYLNSDIYNNLKNVIRDINETCGKLKPKVD
jgi:very-short-patch-repair endonuclease